MRYQFIGQHSNQFSITLMCRVLDVSSSGFYAWRTRRPSKRKAANEALEVAVRDVFKASEETYGSPRIARELRSLGETCSENRVARLMQAAGLRASAPRRFVVTTDSRHGLPIAENILNREFRVDAPNVAWVSDITYIWTAQGWLYLAIVIDLYSRRVIGWSLNNHMRAEIVVKALKMGVGNRSGQDLRGLVFHSDRGSQFASEEFRSELAQHSMTQSMSRKGNCWDNAPAESFIATLKTELIYRKRYLNADQARMDIFRYIEIFYNRKRLHSTLGYVSPAEFERRRQHKEVQQHNQQPMLTAA
jgi:transposase InsO family protein